MKSAAIAIVCAVCALAIHQSEVQPEPFKAHGLPFDADIDPERTEASIEQTFDITSLLTADRESLKRILDSSGHYQTIRKLGIRMKVEFGDEVYFVDRDFVVKSPRTSYKLSPKAIQELEEFMFVHTPRYRNPWSSSGRTSR